MAAEFQPELDLLLRAVNDKTVRTRCKFCCWQRLDISTPFRRTFVGPTISALDGMLIGSIHI